MKKALAISLLFFVSLAASAQPAYRVDFSSVDAFFDAIAKLKKGQELTDEQWDTFLRTGGYPFLSFDLKGRMNIAFLPAKQPQRDSLRALTFFNFATYTVNHLLEVEQHLPAIQAYRRKTNFDSLLQEAHTLVSQFVPEEVDINASSPPLYFALFQPDAYQNDTVIVADLYAAMKMGEKGFVKTLAHEIYHYYRKQAVPFLTYRYLRDNGGRHYQVLKTLDNLHNEGSADLIDKTHPSAGDESFFSLFLPDSFVKTYDSSFYATPETLRRMDSLLISAANDTGRVSYEIYDLLDFGGHPQGFYMASLIKDELGLAPIINSFDNPVAFIRLYNRAAQLSSRGAFVFSSEAIGYLEELEQQHFVR